MIHIDGKYYYIQYVAMSEVIVPSVCQQISVPELFTIQKIIFYNANLLKLSYALTKLL